MTEDRQMVAQAVLDGVISADYLTDSELEAIEIRVQEFCMQREMDAAESRGLSVFDGVDSDPVH